MREIRLGNEILQNNKSSENEHGLFKNLIAEGMKNFEFRMDKKKKESIPQTGHDFVD